MIEIPSFVPKMDDDVIIQIIKKISNGEIAILESEKNSSKENRIYLKDDLKNRILNVIELIKSETKKYKKTVKKIDFSRMSASKKRILILKKELIILKKLLKNQSYVMYTTTSYSDVNEPISDYLYIEDFTDMIKNIKSYKKTD